MLADANMTADNMAYTAVYEGADEGRNQAGWYLGMAVRNEAGYNQLKPGYGPYKDEQAARDHARELNGKLGHDEEKAFEIVGSTIAAQIRQTGGAAKPDKKHRGRR